MTRADGAGLLDRFENPRMRHRLGQIAADGSQKLAVRIVPTLRAERAAVRGLVGLLDAELAEDLEVVAAVVDQARGLGTR